MNPVLDVHPLTLGFRDRELERQYQEAWTRSSLRAIRLGLGIGLGLTSVGVLTDPLLAPALAPPMAWLRLGVAAPLMLLMLGLTYLPWAQRRLADVVLVGVGFWVVGFLGPAFLLVLPQELGPRFSWLWVLLVGGAHTLLQLGFVRSSLLGWLGVAGTAVTLWYHRAPALDVGLQTSGLVLLSLGGMAGAYLNERRDRLLFLEGQLLAQERERAEVLLLNILPAAIAEQLKARPGTIASSLSDVGVLFSDLVGFTRMSARLPAEEVVRRLNELFTAFDDLAAQHGLEKIKTIGDAYMVISGAPQPREGHLEALASMALDMQAVVKEFSARLGEPLDIRVGMHLGPAVAGVIGKRKFSYDLWGDTVNTASRMESHGVPGGIQVSEPVYQRLQGAFRFEPRGVLDIKGKGPMPTWLLVGRLQPVKQAG